RSIRASPGSSGHRSFGTNSSIASTSEGADFMAAGLLALVIAALFTGAALYITLVEQPARLSLADAPLLAHWKPSYARGCRMQASLALLGGLLGVVTYTLTHDLRWLLGAFILLANWPFTLIAIVPINRRLHAIDENAAGHESRRLIEKWGRLHAVRTIFGAL